MKNILAALAAFAALLFAAHSPAAAPDGLASSVSVYAGGAFMRQYSNDCGGYYGDYYYCGPYVHSSDTYSGPEFGVDARIVMPVGLLFDLTAEHARVSDNGDAFKEQQFTAGVGYEGRIGLRASWYVAGFYQRYQLAEGFYGCDYSCNGWYKANGGGLKGGLIWPFADRFYGTLNLRTSYLAGSGDNVDLWQARLDASVGYMLTDNFSVALGAASQALEQTSNRGNRYDYGYYDQSDDVLSHTSVFAKLTLHF